MGYVSRSLLPRSERSGATGDDGGSARSGAGEDPEEESEADGGGLFTRDDRLRIFAALMHSHGHAHAHAHTHAIARAVVESRRPAVAHGDAHVEVVKGGPAPPPPLPTPAPPRSPPRRRGPRWWVP